MNSKTLVRISNAVGIIAILLLIYWVFIFICVEVFGFKLFRENITETFFMSIIGILALMLGALFINVMYNLTRIADKHNNDESLAEAKKQIRPIWKWAFPVSFLLIFIFLYTGDYTSSKKKEKMLIGSAHSIIENNQQKADSLLNYSFSKEWINNTANILSFFSKTDKNFPNVAVIVKDTIDNSEVYLGYTRQDVFSASDTSYPKKINYIQSTTKEERDYLEKVFNERLEEKRYSAHDGNYELFYPYTKNGKKIVLYFTDYQRYGKIGS